MKAAKMTKAVSQQKMVLNYMSLDRYHNSPSIENRCEPSRDYKPADERVLGGRANFHTHPSSDGRIQELAVSLTVDEVAAIEEICKGAVKRTNASINS